MQDIEIADRLRRRQGIPGFPVNLLGRSSSRFSRTRHGVYVISPRTGVRYLLKCSNCWTILAPCFIVQILEMINNATFPRTPVRGGLYVCFWYTFYIGPFWHDGIFPFRSVHNLSLVCASRVISNQRTAECCTFRLHLNSQCGNEQEHISPHLVRTTSFSCGRCSSL